AAARLGWPLGSVKGRLARARDLLRDRLARRGLALSAAGLTAALGESAGAAVPPNLLTLTLQAAVSFAVGESATASARAAVLAKGALQTMAAPRLVSALFAVLALCGLGVGAAFMVASGSKETPAAPAAKEDAPPIPAPRGGPPATPQPQEGAQPKKEPGANVANGLRLSLRLDKTQTRVRPDGTDIEPVNLRFTYANVGDRPVKLDMTVAAALCGTRLEVTGPRVRKHPGKKPANQPDKLTPNDFRALEPGQEWSIDLPFPVYEFFWDQFVVKQPGEYRIKTVYALEKETDHPLARGCWTGSVTSNEVVLLVLPTDGYGEGVKGLRAKITLAKTKFEVGEAIPVSYVVKNVSKEGQTLWHSGFWPDH